MVKLSHQMVLGLTCFVFTVTMASILIAEGPKISDPAKVDSDYALQGEYSGNYEDGDGNIVKAGAQVIAGGNGRFRLAFYPGGLPGDGFKNDKSTIVRVDGELKDGQVRFHHKEHGTAVLNDGRLEIHDLTGQEGSVLSKVNRQSSTLGKKPPAGAMVLFNGKNVDAWENGKKTPDGLLMTGQTSKARFQDHYVHVEFRLPYQPLDRGQARGNAGIYVQGRYEVQMLDSFGLFGKMNECGGVYSVSDTPINMCFPPLVWQTYDIYYTAARYDNAGKLMTNPWMTVYHNGVKIHDKLELPGDRNTTAAPLGAGPEAGPVYLQDHGCPVRFRNVWVVESAQE